MIVKSFVDNNDSILLPEPSVAVLEEGSLRPVIANADEAMSSVINTEIAKNNSQRNEDSFFSE